MTKLRLMFFLFSWLPCLWMTVAHGEPAQGAYPWRTLAHVQDVFGVTNYVWDGDSLCFSNSHNHVRFYQGRRKSDVNGTVIWLNALPDGSVTAGNWRLSGVDLDFLKFAVLPQEEGTLKPVHVMLDPGHGGDDDGASSKHPLVREKDLTLSMALQIGKKLQASGLTVSYTRTNDTTLTLDDRSRFARKAGADLFVSVHANYAGNSEATGVETYILPPSGFPGTADGSRPRGWQIGNRNDYHNTLLGFSIHKKLSVLNQACDRGLKRQSFFVLRETSCPAVLLEFGFLSNAAETRKMLDAAWQDTCALSITDGILSYAKKVDALDAAITDKRKRDAEANDRWRLHLAAHASSAQPPPAHLEAASGSTAASSNALPSLVNLLPLVSNHLCVVASHAPSLTNTNIAPAEINALIDFYAAGKVE